MARSAVPLIVLATLLAPAGSAWARNYNYQDIPLGERAFGMGSVSMALDGDVGNIFFNPATLARETSGQVSAALTAYTRIDARSGDYTSLFESAKQNVSKGGFVPIPSMVGGNLKTGEYTWGGAILVPFSYRNFGETKEGTNKITSFQAFQEDVWLGAFVARRIGNWDVGASVFYASRSSNEKFFFVDKDATTGLTGVRFYDSDFSVNGMLAVLGANYEPDEGLRVGLSVRPPVLAFGGHGAVSDSVNGSTTDGRFQTASYKVFTLPVRLSGGLSYQISSKILLAADLHYYLPMKTDLSHGTNDGAEFRFDAKGIANAAMGIEVLPWEKVGLRAGFFTNVSSARTVPMYLTAIQDRVHMFGGSAAVFFPKKTGSISLGGFVQGGQGSIAEAGKETVAVPRSNYIYGFVIASSYRF